MPTRNQYYRDPALAQAFNNLAGMFAPPSGADLAGYATAKMRRDEASRLSELFNYAKNPSYNREQADRLGIAAGRYNPNQSYYSVDQGNATQRYGVDVGARTSITNNAADNATRRYGIDTTAQTSLTNNAADNTRAIQTNELDNSTRRYGIDTTSQTALINNAADNSRAIQTNDADNVRALAANRADNQRATIQSMFGPLNPGQVRPAVPSAIAETQGLPELPLEAGVPKPMSETEARGAAFNDLRANGVLTDQQILDTIQGKETPVQAIGPDGKPIYMSPGAAVRQGAQPVPAAASGAPKIISYKSPSGQSGTAVFDAASRQFIDTQTQQVVPQGSVEVKAQGTPDDALGQGTKNAIDKQLLNISQAKNTIGRYGELVRASPGVQGLVGKLQGTMQNVMQAGGEVSAMLAANQQATQDLITQRRFAPDVMQRFANFRADIPAAEALRQMLIAQIAAATTNDDQVSNKDIERVELQIGGGSFFSNTADTLARLDQVSKDLEARSGVLRQAGTSGSRIFGGGASAPAQPNAAPAAPNAAPRARLRFDEQGNQIP